MQVEFTRHARARMTERGISEDEVRHTLTHPLRTLQAEGGRLESQGWSDRNGKRMLLRVLYEHDIVITVVTVMVTSRLEKYGVSP